MMINPLILQTARDVLAEYGDAVWLLAARDATPGASAGAVIYICDALSGRVLVLPTAVDALQILTDRSELDEPTYHEIRAATSILIGDVLGSVDGIHPDTRRGLILGAAFCVTQTRGFHITKHHGADVQYLLVRYPDISCDNHVLVPMPLFKVHPLASSDLEASVMHVLSSERLNFPDRFAAARALKFSQSRRSVVSAGTAPSR